MRNMHEENFPPSAGQVRVLLVCMGNICRSPTAEGVLRAQVRARGWEDRFLIDSAGTISSHAGNPPDSRSQQAALGRGYDLSLLRARQVKTEDFHRFDWLLAMDRDNLSVLQQRCPAPELASKLRLFLSFAGCPVGDEVPDPYYGGATGFERVLDLCEEGARGFLAAYAEGRLSPSS